MWVVCVDEFENSKVEAFHTVEAARVRYAQLEKQIKADHREYTVRLYMALSHEWQTFETT